MTKYQINKERARQEAIDWQRNFLDFEEDRSYTFGELVEWYDYFEKLGKRYGLTKEFRENGII